MTGAQAVYWCLRVAAAACFIGHGAFGIITKAAWVPFFGVVGIPEAWAWKLMPVVGTMDILMGLSALFYPTRAVLLWAATHPFLRARPHSQWPATKQQSADP